MQVDRNRSRVQLRVEELRPLVVAAAARTVPPEHRAAWEAADIVVDGVLDPVVVGAATLALDPHRAVLLERSDGRTLSRVHVGWARDGRAAITEQGPDGQLAITASHLALLPALVMQILRLHPGIPRRRSTATSWTSRPAAMPRVTSWVRS